MSGYLITHRLTLWRTRRDEYLAAYSAFSAAFDNTIQQIKTNGTTLNLLILSEYPKHEAAMSVFIHRLSGKRRRKFQETWNDYQNIYQNLKSLPGWVAATAAILPTPDATTTPADLAKYENDRVQNLFCIIHNLLDIGKIKKWL